MNYCSILNRRVFVKKLETHRRETINKVYAPNEESGMFQSSVRKPVDEPNKRLYIVLRVRSHEHFSLAKTNCHRNYGKQFAFTHSSEKC